MTISIKMEPELRHVLAHLVYAIQALAKGQPAEALYEIKGFDGLIFWDSDEGQTSDAKEWLALTEGDGNGEVHEELQKEGRQGRKGRQGDEELQE